MDQREDIWVLAGEQGRECDRWQWWASCSFLQSIFHFSFPELTFEFGNLVVSVGVHPTTQKNDPENYVPTEVKLEEQSKTKPKDMGVVQRGGAIQGLKVECMDIISLGGHFTIFSNTNVQLPLCESILKKLLDKCIKGKYMELQHPNRKHVRSTKCSSLKTLVNKAK